MNIFAGIPENSTGEFLETICTGGQMRIERIVSRGHKSEPDFWYDQKDNEWVIVLKGAAKIEFEDGRKIHLTAGAYVNILAHERHRVAWTDDEGETMWLTVHYRG
ncbi:MAG: cupin domain-containing protein [Deltaproteobacteria bacterium]|nr:cupin domain-containing protein [Deltaproteobacteria bacterium]